MDSPVPQPGAGVGTDDLEIVGFNGVPLVECGRALPIVRRKSTDRFFKLLVRSGAAPALECGRRELEALSNEGRLTLFENPLPLPNRLTVESGEAARQPMVLCVSQTFLDAAGCFRPEQQKGEILVWQKLPGHEPVFWVTCASETGVEHLLDFWASRFLPQADDLLAEWQADWAKAFQAADLGLCAAIDRALRWRLWTRYAAALAWSPEPERVRRTFDRLVRLEFPTCSWEDFTRE
jgi:hypothetical protein